jgi:hypothetical protein
MMRLSLPELIRLVISAKVLKSISFSSMAPTFLVLRSHEFPMTFIAKAMPRGEKALGAHIELS